MGRIEHDLKKDDALLLVKEVVSSKFAIQKDKGYTLIVGALPPMTAKIVIEDSYILVNGSGIGKPIANTCESLIRVSINKGKNKENNNDFQVCKTQSNAVDDELKILEIISKYKEFDKDGTLDHEICCEKINYYLSKLRNAFLSCYSKTTNDSVGNHNSNMLIEDNSTNSKDYSDEYCKETTQKEYSYQNACDLISKKRFHEALQLFKLLSDYRDSKEQIELCNEEIYQIAISYENDKKYESAKEQFSKIIDYKDSKEKLTLFENEEIYQMAISYENNKEYESAKEQFSKIIDYKDSKEKVEMYNEEIYQNAISYENNKEYESAKEQFSKVFDYKDSASRYQECNAIINEDKYLEAVKLGEENQYNAACIKFEQLGDYKDSKEKYEHYLTEYNRVINNNSINKMIIFSSFSDLDLNQFDFYKNQIVSDLLEYSQKSMLKHLTFKMDGILKLKKALDNHLLIYQISFIASILALFISIIQIKNTNLLIFLIIIFSSLSVGLLVIILERLETVYKEALIQYENGLYDWASYAFKKISHYKKSKKMYIDCNSKNTGESKD